MLQTIETRLAGWGYEVTSADDIPLQFLIDKTDNYIKNYCNVPEVPGELFYSEVDLVAMEYLKEKAAAGGLDGTSLSFGNISTITEGDTSVSYDNGDGSATVAGLYASMKARFEADLLPFRRMRW